MEYNQEMDPRKRLVVIADDKDCLQDLIYFFKEF